jgi:thioredoxin 1
VSEQVTIISDGTFESEILSSDIPAILDFWAPWCGPCKSIAPVLDDLAREYKGKVKICKMNVDENPQTPSRYNVRGIPNIVFFKDGEVVEQIVGAVPKEQLRETIDKLF